MFRFGISGSFVKFGIVERRPHSGLTVGNILGFGACKNGHFFCRKKGHGGCRCAGMFQFFQGFEQNYNSLTGRTKPYLPGRSASLVAWNAVATLFLFFLVA